MGLSKRLRREVTDADGDVSTMDVRVDELSAVVLHDGVNASLDWNRKHQILEIGNPTLTIYDQWMLVKSSKEV